MFFKKMETNAPSRSRSFSCKRNREQSGLSLSRSSGFDRRAYGAEGKTGQSRLDSRQDHGVPISAGEHYLHCDRGEKGGLSLYRRAG